MAFSSLFLVYGNITKIFRRQWGGIRQASVMSRAEKGWGELHKLTSRRWSVSLSNVLTFSIISTLYTFPVCYLVSLFSHYVKYKHTYTQIKVAFKK